MPKGSNQSCIKPVDQAGIGKVGASEPIERILENDAAVWVPNSLFGNSAVRLCVPRVVRSNAFDVPHSMRGLRRLQALAQVLQICDRLRKLATPESPIGFPHSLFHAFFSGAHFSVRFFPMRNRGPRLVDLLLCTPTLSVVPVSAVGTKQTYIKS
jgi:hypothetical protein